MLTGELPPVSRGGMLKQHRAARGDTVPDRHHARLDNLRSPVFFPKRANVSLSSRYLHALHIVSAFIICSLLLYNRLLLQHDDIID